MKNARYSPLRIGLFFLLVVAVVSAPFVIWGDEYVLPLLESQQQRTGALVAIAVILLAADSVAPVPATLVIMFLAAKAGVVAGIVGGTLGMSAGVLTAGWLGQAAGERIAPKFFPDAELARMREGLQRNLALTLACWRSVPVLAETSVLMAALLGVPMRRIFLATLVPNFVISTIYSFAADDSLLTASVTFLSILVVSLLLWKLFAKKGPVDGAGGR
jgi:uncharacterized membrane protein YdjX (TVP38/TMEM64 family)